MSYLTNFLKNKNYNLALKECYNSSNFFLGKLLGSFMNNLNTEKQYKKICDKICCEINHKEPEKIYRIFLLCHWCSSRELADLWNKMTKGDYRWNNIQIVWEEPYDYAVILNAPQGLQYLVENKTMIFHMEPGIPENARVWGHWSKPSEKRFLRVFTHKKDYANFDWHISKTFSELSTQEIVKDKNLENVLSTVLSKKYFDSGHVKRIDFARFLEKKMGNRFHIFGDNYWNFKDHKGSLPYHCKDKALLPYKYTFNVENKSIQNYFTEKLVDGILSECLVFYSGCYNIREYIDERAYVYLELSNFEKDYEIILKAISEDWHSQRLPYIKDAKRKILNELQFFPRLEKIISEIEKEEEER